MLKLNASYSKKIPVDGTDFSSQCFHAAVEAELPDGLTAQQLQERIHRTFMLVRDAVEAELHGTQVPVTAAPVAVQAAPAAAPAPVAFPARQSSGRPRNGAPSQHSNQPASGKQVQFLTDLAMRRGMSLQQLGAEVRQRYGVQDLVKLSRGQASELIDAFTAELEAARRAA